MVPGCIWEWCDLHRTRSHACSTGLVHPRLKVTQRMMFIWSDISLRLNKVCSHVQNLESERMSGLLRTSLHVQSPSRCHWITVILIIFLQDWNKYSLHAAASCDVCLDKTTKLQPYHPWIPIPDCLLTYTLWSAFQRLGFFLLGCSSWKNNGLLTT